MLDIELPLICNVTLIEVSIALISSPQSTEKLIILNIFLIKFARENFFEKVHQKKILIRFREKTIIMIRKTKRINFLITHPPCILSDEATDVITGVGGKTYLVYKHPSTKITTIIDKATQEKEFVVAKEISCTAAL